MKKRITIHPGDRAEFRNLTNYCVGTGRLDLALHKEYQEQLFDVLMTVAKTGSVATRCVLLFQMALETSRSR